MNVTVMYRKLSPKQMINWDKTQSQNCTLGTNLSFLSRQTVNTLKVGVNYRTGLLYVGFFMYCIVAPCVSKETPYLSGWWSSPPAVAAPRIADPPLLQPLQADPAAPWSPRWNTHKRLNFWSSVPAVSHNDKYCCFAMAGV